MKTILILITVLVTACSSTNITSNKDSSFNEKLKDVFILFKSADTYKEFTQQTADSLKKHLSERGISCQIDVRLSTEEEDDKQYLTQKLKEYNPQAIVIINTVGIKEIWQAFIIFPVKTGTYIDYDISVLDIASQKRVWRCNLQINRSNYGNVGEKEAGSFVKSFIDQLRKDLLL